MPPGASVPAGAARGSGRRAAEVGFAPRRARPGQRTRDTTDPRGAGRPGGGGVATKEDGEGATAAAQHEELRPRSHREALRHGPL